MVEVELAALHGGCNVNMANRMISTIGGGPF